MKPIKSLFASAKSDLVSGLVVFLIALPLCLGIAQASGAPLLSGIVSGVVGGIIIGLLSRSQLSVSGPAAGLVAIVLGALAELGTFEIFLCAVMLAGLFQLLFGFLKAGSVAGLIPLTVIEGMLAGIGLTIIIKQIPDALGMAPGREAPGWGTLVNAPALWLDHIAPGALLIALIGLGILMLWQTRRMRRWRLVPAGLLVVLIGAALNGIFSVFFPELGLSAAQLVTLPIPETLGQFIGQFKRPDFSGFSRPEVWQAALVIAIVASIESLLSIEATDKLDPEKRTTPANSELKAQGVGNVLSGLLGGLPITTVIVRSSANINAGAKSKLSAVWHGLLLLVCVATIPAVLNFIPKATLAAILIFTGYRLCRPAVIRHVWRAGIAQFLPFAVTALAVVFLDLLQGVGLGIVICVFFILKNNLRTSFSFQRSIYRRGEVIRLNLGEEVSFLNKGSLKSIFEKLPAHSVVVVDASKTAYIDYDVREVIKDFREHKAPRKDIRVFLVGFKHRYQIRQQDEDPFSHCPDDELLQRTAGRRPQKLLRQLTAGS